MFITKELLSVLADLGGIPLLVDLLKSESEELLEKIVCMIRVIAHQNYAYRDMIIQGGGVNNIIAVLGKFKNNAKLL